MNLYLDDNIAQTLLVTLLRQAGHDVQLPADAGLTGARDPIHLTHAVGQGRVLLTQNYRDFEDRHGLILAVQGHYPGMLLVRRDNNPKRDLSPAGIVRALRKLEASGTPVQDNCLVLNQWR